MSLNEAETVDARTIVELIRARNWQEGGALLVDEADAVRLVATALRVAQDRGVIDGMERMGAIAGKAFATKAFATPPATIAPLALPEIGS